MPPIFARFPASLKMGSLDAYDRLMSAGVLDRGQDLTEIECDACGDAHIESVNWIGEPPGTETRAYIACPVAGRVRVQRERLEVWRIDGNQVARIAGKVLDISDAPRALVEERIWFLGTRRFGDRVKDLFLIRGATWHDGRQLLENAVRLRTSPAALILVPNLLPRDTTWTAGGRVVISMSEFDWFADDPHEVLDTFSALVREYDSQLSPIDSRVFRKEGEYWAISFSGKTIRMRDSKGTLYLSYLVGGPDRVFPAVEILATAEGHQVTPVRTSAGEVLDKRGMNQYRTRASEINDEIEEARSNNDVGRVERLRIELEHLAEQMAAARGLGGRRRVIGDTNERARKAVGQAITRSITQFRKVHAGLAQHLEKQVTLGSSLSYSGDGTPWMT